MPKIRVCLMGRHAHRTPFAYEAYKSIMMRHFVSVDDPTQADAIVFGYATNIDDGAAELEKLLSDRPELRIIVVSEEPLWDTTNSGDFRKRQNVRDVGGRKISYSVVNHHTSNIYEFYRFPYFITTSNDFFLRYSSMFHQNSSFSVKSLLDAWQKAPVRQAYFAEKRTLAKKYDVAWPEIETWGLSVYRTEIASMSGAGAKRVGQGWGNDIARQNLPDWHLDKLASLRGQSRVVSAIENTSQRNYVSEKIFDAFAARALPLYWAPPSHRVNELVPSGSFLNLFGLEPKQAVDRIETFKTDSAFAEVYLEAQIALTERFRYYDDFITERIEFTDRLHAQMEAILGK